MAARKNTANIVVTTKDLPSELIEELEVVYEVDLYKLKPEIINIDKISSESNKIILRGKETIDYGFTFDQIYGTREECIDKFSKILDYLEQEIKKHKGKEAKVDIFAFDITSCGYDGFDESCEIEYSKVESDLEYNLRKLKLETIPKVIEAREWYNKIYNQKLEQQKREANLQFEKELEELKKKHGVL